MTPPLIFLIDDEPLFAQPLSLMLRQESFDVEVFASAEDFLAREPYLGVGCLLLDLTLPGMDGNTLLEALQKRPMTTPIIILSGTGDIAATVRSMKHGAMNFLTKPIQKEDLLRAIGEAVALSRRIQPFCSRLATLTPRERDVLDAMLLGLLNKQIASRLGISEKTTKIHRGRIMEKLSVPSLPELVRLWVECGLPLGTGAGSAATPGGAPLQPDKS
ncbi:MAG: response regulator transcription factor [Candidatus Riflebacteria bacterium]|nr:response regulator transcription factor [Candidatus Riflebacteria bacterium]